MLIMINGDREAAVIVNLTSLINGERLINSKNHVHHGRTVLH